jgi:hypothetical protein
MDPGLEPGEMGEGDHEVVEGAAMARPSATALRRVTETEIDHEPRPLHHFVVPLPRCAE